MGSGGLIQLLASMSPDCDFHTQFDNSGHSFWKHRYSTQNHFALESIRQEFKTPPGFGKKATCVIGRHADLLSSVVVEIVLRRGTGPVFFPAEHLLRNVSLTIAGARIDAITNTWLRLYDELYRCADEREAHRQMADFADEPEGSVKRLYVPLPFWFGRGDSGSALPLVALNQ